MLMRHHVRLLMFRRCAFISHCRCRSVPISTTASAVLLRVSKIKVADINVSNEMKLISLQFAWQSFIHFRAILVFPRKMKCNRLNTALKFEAIFVNCQNECFDEMRGATFVPLEMLTLRHHFVQSLLISNRFLWIYQLHQPHISGEINLSSSGIEFVWTNSHIDDGVIKSMRLNFNINMIELELQFFLFHFIYYKINMSIEHQSFYTLFSSSA